MEKVLGFDPGATTGYCLVVTRADNIQVVASGEISITDISYDKLYKLIKQLKPKRIVVEDVVKTGRMSKDKFNQVRAFDRVTETAKRLGFEPEIISPELRKRAKVAPPKTVEGQHAKDAYLIATYDSKLNIDMGEDEGDTDEKNSGTAKRW